MGGFELEFPHGKWGKPLVGASAASLVGRLLDLSLAGTAFAIGAGGSWAWLLVSASIGLSLAAGALRPNALGKPYLLFGLALGVNWLLAWPQLSGLTAAHAWAMGRPAIAFVLAGAIANGARASVLAMIFTVGAASRAVVALLVGDASFEALLFLPASALLFLVAAWAIGALRGLRLAAAAALCLPLGAVLWSLAIPGAWIALAAGIVTMALLGRMGRRLIAPLGVAACLAGLSYGLAKDPFQAVELGSVWSQALDLLAANPAGIGAGNYASRSQEAAEAVGRAAGSHPHNSLLAVWAENGPVGLIAAVWILCALFGSLRRGWKSLGANAGETRSGTASAMILGAAGVAGLFLVWSFTDDPLAEPVVGHGLGLLLALGLASVGRAGLPSQEESLFAIRERSRGALPLPRKAAAGAALAIGGAAIGGISALGSTSPAIRLVCLGLLIAVGILHLPWLRSPLALSLRGLVVFMGVALLATRPFAVLLEPGSVLWWQSPSAAVALCALAAAVSGAGHAIRRPGRIRPAPVAGALSFVGVALFVTMLDYGWLASIAPGFHPEAPYNFAVAACAVSLLFMAWSGPLAFGEAEVDPLVRRLVHLPAAAVVVGLAATVLLGR